MSTPTPAPAFPFVGARAQVTVAEWDDGTPSRLSVGDIGTLTALVKDDTSEWIVKRDDGRFGYVAARHLRPVPVSPGPDQPRGPRHPDVLAAPLSRDALSGRRYTGPTEPGPDQPTDCGKCLAADNWRGKPAEHVGPDQPTEHEDWRVSGLTDFLVRDGRGVVVAMFHRPEDAARVVSDHQDAPALRAEVQRLTEENERLTGMAAAADHVVRLAAERDHAIAERDAARTEVKRQKGALAIAYEERDRARRDHYGDLARVKAERDAARAELDAATTDGLGLPQVEVRREQGLRCAYIGGEPWLSVEDYDDAAWLTNQSAAVLALRADRIAEDAERARLAGKATTDDKETDRG